MEINQFDQKMLKPFDDMLRCRICSEFFNYCVITACSHNFCSACLKKQMETESDCCICYEEIKESELRSNRSMDKIVRIYKKLMKTNAVDSSESQLQQPNNSQRNYNSSERQSRNYLPVQISSTRSIPITSPIHNQSQSPISSSASIPLQIASPINNQSQSSTSFTISSARKFPAQIASPICNIQSQSQSSTSAISSTGTAPVQTVSSFKNLPSGVTLPVVLLQRIKSAALHKANTVKESQIFDDYEDLENCSFTDDSNDSEDD